MLEMLAPGALLNAVLFVIAGIVVLALAVNLFIRLLPGNLWRQVTEQENVAAAIVLAAVILALGWVVAAAVH